MIDEKGLEAVIHPRTPTSQITITISSYNAFNASNLASHLQSEANISILNTLSTEGPFIQSVIGEEVNILLIHPKNVDASIQKACYTLETVQPQTKQILLLLSDDFDQCLQAVRTGAQGILFYNTMALGELVYAIRRVHEGKQVIASHVIQNMLSVLEQMNSSSQGSYTTPPSTLTLREAEIFSYLVTGLSNREIAEKLCVEVKTVKNHLTNIYGKLQVRGRSEAIANYYNTGPAYSSFVVH